MREILMDTSIYLGLTPLRPAKLDPRCLCVVLCKGTRIHVACHFAHMSFWPLSSLRTSFDHVRDFKLDDLNPIRSQAER